jgi:hypothetical protein
LTGLAIVGSFLVALNGAPVTVAADITLETPRNAVTGQLYTLKPVFPPGVVMAPDVVCRHEFRWGDDDALFNLNSNNTFGGILFEGPASKGYCDEWTFTLPWVPYRQYDYSFSAPGYYPRKTFKASVGSTNPHIATSNLPLVYVLPTSKDVVVGKPMTFTLYRLGGAGQGRAGRWVGHLVGSGATAGTEVQFTQNGGSTFTFTPTRPGYWEAGWDPAPGYPWVLSGYYDPPVKRAPATPKPAAPTATTPPTEPPPTPTVEPAPTLTEPPPATPGSSLLTAQVTDASPVPTAGPSLVDAVPSTRSDGPEILTMVAGLAALVLVAGGLLAVGLASGRLRFRRANPSKTASTRSS